MHYYYFFWYFVVSFMRLFLSLLRGLLAFTSFCWTSKVILFSVILSVKVVSALIHLMMKVVSDWVSEFAALLPIYFESSLPIKDLTSKS